MRAMAWRAGGAGHSRTRHRRGGGNTGQDTPKIPPPPRPDASNCQYKWVVGWGWDPLSLGWNPLSP